MIFDAASGYQSHHVLLGDPADVWIKACLKVGGDKRSAFFRAENAVHQIADV